MPIIMSVDHERKLVNAIAIGPVSFSDVENHLLMERQFGGLTYKELVDARGAGIAFTPTEIRQIVALIRTLGQKSKLGPSAVPGLYGLCFWRNAFTRSAAGRCLRNTAGLE